MRAARLVPLLAAALGALTALSPSCENPELVLENDAGGEAWVKRATLLMWGRRPASLVELDVLVQLEEQLGRADAIRAMGRSAEYRDHWVDGVFDSLLVNRTGGRAASLCYRVRLHDAPGPEIAGHVASGPAATTEPWPEPFTMGDLAVSALALDDLSVLARANLYPSMSNFFDPPNLLEAEAERRALAEVFEAGWLGRSHACLPCHNSEYSATGHVDPEHDRTWEVPGLVERAIYGDSAGRDLDDLAHFFRRHGVVHGFVVESLPPPDTDLKTLHLEDGCREKPDRAGCGGCPCEEAVCAQDPSCCEDGWTQGCADLCLASSPGREGCQDEIPEDFDGCSEIIGLSGEGCGGCACEEEVCGNDSACCEDRWDAFCAEACGNVEGNTCPWTRARQAEDALRPWGLAEQCGRFVRKEDVDPDAAGGAGWLVRDYGSRSTVFDLEEMLLDGITRLKDGGMRVREGGEVRGEDALAWLWAMRVAEVAWQAAHGTALTLSHRFPRNEGQRDILASLAGRFVGSDFSLVELLVAVATHPLFNQHAPADAAAESAYYIEPVFDPWSVEEDAEEERGNSLGDTVHRMDTRTLLRSTYAALGWERHEPFPTSADSFYGRALAALGAFVKDAEPGFDGTGLQWMLAWEELVGGCNQPPERPDAAFPCQAREEPGCPGCECRANVCLEQPSCCTESWDVFCAERCRIHTGCHGDGPTPPDWVDALIGAATEQGASWEDVIRALRERILLDPDLSSEAERNLLEELLEDSLEAPFPGEDGEVPLRLACGAMLSSPQVVFAGLAGPDRLDAAPAPVRLPGDDFRTHCERVAPLVPGASCSPSALSVP